MTALSEHFKQYVACEDLAENTIPIKETALRYFIRQFGDVDPNVVTTKHAEQYKASLGDGLRKKLKKVSRNSYISNIKPFFKWMHDWDYIKNNPFKRIKLFKAEKKTHKAYTPQEIERIFEFMAVYKPQKRLDMLDCGMCMQVAFALALCGMRRGEVFNTTVKDFSVDDNGRGVIRLSHKEDRKINGKYVMWRWGSKGKTERYVPVPSWARDIILNRINYLEPPQPYLAIPKYYYDRAIKKMNDGKVSENARRDIRNCAYSNFNRDFKGILERANVEEGKTLHSTRFTMCMNLFKKGVQVAAVQKIIGHASINTTIKHYMEFDQQQLCKDAAEHLESYMTL